MLGQELPVLRMLVPAPFKREIYPHKLFLKKESVSLHELVVGPIFPSCYVLPHQVNSVCWASLNHLDSHILYLLADEEVWWGL